MKDFGDQLWRHAHGGLVQQEQIGPGHERSGNRHLLLLATRKRPRALVGTRFDPGEQLQDRLQALGDLLLAVQDGSSPLLLTARTEHLRYFETALAGKVESVFVLKGGMGKKQRRSIAEAIAAVPEDAPRVILATGSYIGEGFDDARLDTLFLAMPISWKGTLQQYVGRLHRLHDAKRVVRVYDYVDSNVPMLARIYARRLKGYNVIGYRISNIPDEVYGTQRQAAGLEKPNAALLG